MTKYLLTALVAGLLLATNAAGADKEDEVKKELEKLQGKWECVSSESAYGGALDALVKPLRLNFEKDTCTITFTYEGKEKKVEAKLTLDPSKKPNTFDTDLVIEGGHLVGIYKLDEETA